MKCYFLNARKFMSKAGKSFFMITIANRDGEVSEFFVSEELYDYAVRSFNPFDYVEIAMSVSRGHVSLCGIEHVEATE